VGIGGRLSDEVAEWGIKKIKTNVSPNGICGVRN
jgi:hypothetical protein